MLLPEEEVSEEEKKELDAARKEIAKGQKISLDALLKRTVLIMSCLWLWF